MNRSNSVIRRFLRQLAVCIYLAVLLLLVTVCVLAPVLAPYDPNTADPLMKFAPMSAEHPLGTDYLGRDMLSRVLWGGRNTMGYALVVSVISALIGISLGMLSGFLGGVTDSVIMKTSDVLRAFPDIVMVLIIVGSLGVGIGNVCIAMLFTRWIWYARMARNMTRSQMARTSIMASRLAGSGWNKILCGQILPSILPQMLAVFSIDFGSTLLVISSYSFLGLGILPPDAEWGMMINDGRNYMNQPGMMFWPGICVLLVVVSVNMLGDRLRDILEEKRT